MPALTASGCISIHSFVGGWGQLHTASTPAVTTVAGEMRRNSQAFAGYAGASILINAIGRDIDANGGRIPSRQQVVHSSGRARISSGLPGTCE